ncbi:hypothetical protein [Methanosarcina mazei]|uniref:Uncharacterized protein n=1 Tax=Methanosarcina mazei TaxID=2209 RepID=A0A0F8F818_METMZ|nr:hypothetical protein [Methanosarcina mazei]KKG49242.1 hypothetical protein DU33_16160 [Methanosarcina mazei]KKG62241.1 hypothetical protein DU45_19100 [Methanosarcina mazei]KKG66202.1 hypothetical protein DU64_15415 [Methanosarcina mazei]
MSTFNQTKATQKAWQYRHYGRDVKYLDFEDWFNWTVEKIKSRGAKVEIICEIVFITWPGQPVTGFSKLDFEDEYKNVYRKGKRATA